MNKKQAERLFSKIEKTEECWNWTARLFSSGYGSISINDKTYKVSRVMYELVFGKIKKGLYVLHKCDNKKCVNPEHLFLGNHKDNMKDMVKKGRQSRGEDSRSKLTEKQVIEIRKIYKKFNQQELADRFKVSRRLIHNIIYKKAWKHI